MSTTCLRWQGYSEGESGVFPNLKFPDFTLLYFLSVNDCNHYFLLFSWKLVKSVFVHVTQELDSGFKYKKLNAPSLSIMMALWPWMSILNSLFLGFLSCKNEDHLVSRVVVRKPSKFSILVVCFICWSMKAGSCLGHVVEVCIKGFVFVLVLLW
jgi:hypothetical protein